jgi:IS30 family transposase
MDITTNTINTEAAMQSYQHFTLEERECLSELLKEGKTQQEIADALGRNKSSVSREIKRNHNKDGTYHPWRATVLYIVRRKRCVRRPILRNEEIFRFVSRGLDQYWPPEAISAKWKLAGGAGLSHSTIYRGIKSNLLPGYAPRTHLRRRGKRKYARGTQTIHPVHTIHDRPEDAELRSRFGDLEGDTVYGAIGKGGLLTLVDRASRYLYTVGIPSRDSAVLKDAFKTALGDVTVNSITLDNGSEFAKFLDIEAQHQTTIYFADPHSPWQRGSNENINGVIRFFFPKGTNFHAVTPDEIQHVATLINNRPRKCLGWLSPVEFVSDKCCT